MNLEYRPRRRAVPSAFHFRYEYLFTSALCYLLYPSVDTYLLPSVDTYLLTYLLYLDKGEPRWPLLDPRSALSWRPTRVAERADGDGGDGHAPGGRAE